MAVSARMMAILERVDAAQAAHFAGLRESAEQEKETARAKKLSARRRPPWSSFTKSSAKPAPKKRRPA